MRAFTYSRAKDNSDALARHRAVKSSEYLAGGTTLIDLIKLDVMRPPEVVDINHLGLSDIQPTPDGGLKIGALARNSDLGRHPVVREKYPVLAEALLSGASAQVRNMATTAGNLLQRTRCQYFRNNVSACNKRVPGSGCAAQEGVNRGHAILGGSEACIATHPSDMAVALAVLDAQIQVEGPDGARSIPILDFHLLPGKTPEREFALKPDELITDVTLPPPMTGARSWYLKLRDRESFEFALASAAVVLAVENGKIRDARVALGGVGTKPWRALEAEAVLRGASASEDTYRRAADAALKDAHPRKYNAFKVELARRVVVRGLNLVTASQPSVRTT
jgi:xanthine dehydrogenase YagS FAD-binding subunit